MALDLISCCFMFLDRQPMPLFHLEVTTESNTFVYMQQIALCTLNTDLVRISHFQLLLTDLQF